MSDRTEVATKVEELSTTLNTDVEDITITIEDGGFSSTVIDGEDIAEFLSEAKDEDQDSDISEADEDTTEGGEDTSEAGDEQTSTKSDDDEPTIEDGEVACQCGAVFDSKQSLYGHSSHCDEYESQSSEKTETTSEAGEDDDDTTEGGENDEDAPLHPDEAENPTKENYVFHFGVCDSDDCSYGTADEESDYCASCKKKHDDSKSTTSSSSPKEDRDLSDLSEAEKNLVSTLIEDEGKSLEEAVSMV